MNQRRGNRLHPVVAGAAVVATVVGISVAATGPGAEEPPAAAGVSGDAAPAGARPALDDVPGLARGPEAAQRDEVISLWEAWARARHTATCMQRGGFDYAPEVAYPEEAVAEVAHALGVTPGTAVADGRAPHEVSDRDKNRRYVDGLRGAPREGYFQRLYGESAATMDHVARTGGELPEGVAAEDFARGGCVGRAELAVGSIWELERELGPELAELREAQHRSEEFRTATADFAECARRHGLDAARGPADVEAAFQAGTIGIDSLESVQKECFSIWVTADRAATARAADQLAARHSARLEAQQNRYAGALERIRHDREFRDFLSGQLSATE